MNANRIWAIATVLAIGAVLGLGYLLGFAPLMAQTADARASIQGVEESNAAQHAVLEQMKDQYERIDEIEELLAQQQLSIPTELDSDFVLAYLAAVQGASQARVETITIGEAQPYGLSPDQVAADPAAPVSGTATFEGLYTVPITIDFYKGTTAEQIVAFAGEMQNGPRLFLVTNVTKLTADDGAAGSIRAYMFVMSHPDDTPGAAVDAYDEALADYVPKALKPWGWQAGATTPPPAESEEAASSEEAPAPETSPTP